jgi:hypothetical protein
MIIQTHNVPRTPPDVVTEGGRRRVWHQTHQGLRTYYCHMKPGFYTFAIPSPELMFVHDGEVSMRTAYAKAQGKSSVGFSPNLAFAPEIGVPLEVEVRAPGHTFHDYTGHSGIDGLTYRGFHLDTEPDLEIAMIQVTQKFGGFVLAETLGILRDYFRNQTSE